MRVRRTGLGLVLAASCLLAGSPAHAAGVMDNACPPERVPPSPFYDTFDNTHEEAIDCAAWYGIATGASENRYNPSGEVRRDQMAAFMARSVYAMRADLPEGTNRFDDVAGNNHADAIERLAQAGIVGGTGGRSYSPSRVVERGQMATFLVRTYEYLTNSELTANRDYFSDDNGTSHEDNINKAAEAGFTTGLSDGRYNPAGAVRRDGMASFIARMLGLAVDRAPGGRLAAYPLRTEIALADNWTMSVVSSDSNANEEVASENQFNDPPEPGRQFYIVRVRATYQGQGSSTFDGNFRLRALGRSGVTYTDFEDSCGVIPDELYESDKETFNGGTIEGNVCYSVKVEDVEGLLVFDNDEERPSRLYFATA